MVVTGESSPSPPRRAAPSVGPDPGRETHDTHARRRRRRPAIGCGAARRVLASHHVRRVDGSGSLVDLAGVLGGRRPRALSRWLGLVPAAAPRVRGAAHPLCPPLGRAGGPAGRREQRRGVRARRGRAGLARARGRRCRQQRLPRPSAQALLRHTEAAGVLREPRGPRAGQRRDARGRRPGRPGDPGDAQDRQWSRGSGLDGPQRHHDHVRRGLRRRLLHGEQQLDDSRQGWLPGCVHDHPRGQPRALGCRGPPGRRGGDHAGGVHQRQVRRGDRLRHQRGLLREAGSRGRGRRGVLRRRAEVRRGVCPRLQLRPRGRQDPGPGPPGRRCRRAQGIRHLFSSGYFKASGSGGKTYGDLKGDYWDKQNDWNPFNGI